MGAQFGSVEFNNVERQVMAILNSIPEKAFKKGWTKQGEWISRNRAKWTTQIKSELCKLGNEMGYYVCPDRTGSRQQKWHDQWLYDLIWLSYTPKGGYLKGVPFVLESEWGDEKAVDDDFQKLLVARADNRILIFQQDSPKKVNEVMDALCKHLSSFKGNKGKNKRDRYLFAGYSRSTSEFKFRLKVV